jgi:hypothetical protein
MDIFRHHVQIFEKLDTFAGYVQVLDIWDAALLGRDWILSHTENTEYTE